MSIICSKLHEIFNDRPIYSFPFEEKLIPTNGIYILFQRGELAHGGNRIVRVGTHNGNNHLRSRLEQHFLKENKDRSIFRKNIGRCLLNRSQDPYLAVWELDFTARARKKKSAHLLRKDYQINIEKRVSKFIQNNFTFTVIPLSNKDDRLFFESRIVSTISWCEECNPSEKWLGRCSPKDKISESGLWQVNELYKQPLSTEDFERVVTLCS